MMIDLRSGISSDDPNAPEKLQEKHLNLLEKQTRIKAVNKIAKSRAKKYRGIDGKEQKVNDLINNLNLSKQTALLCNENF